jgi:carbonic anhydrase
MTFPWVQQGVEQKSLFIHGWFFNLATGIIDAYDFQSDQFKELQENAGVISVPES